MEWSVRGSDRRLQQRLDAQPGRSLQLQNQVHTFSWLCVKSGKSAVLLSRCEMHLFLKTVFKIGIYGFRFSICRRIPYLSSISKWETSIQRNFVSCGHLSLSHGIDWWVGRWLIMVPFKDGLKWIFSHLLRNLELNWKKRKRLGEELTYIRMRN